jgi:hypothetical protein
MFGDVWLAEGFFRRAGSHGSTAGRMPAATSGNGFWREAENGNQDGRAPQQCPSRVANGGFGVDEQGKGRLNFCRAKDAKAAKSRRDAMTIAQPFMAG